MKRSKKRWEELLDALWRYCIHVRDDYTCQYVKKALGINVRGTDAHHIFSRTNRSTRWDTDNGICLKGYHNYSDAHVNPEIFRRFLIDKWFKSEEKYEELFQKSRQNTHYKVEDYEAMLNDLATELRNLLKEKPKYKAVIRKKLKSLGLGRILDV